MEIDAIILLALTLSAGVCGGFLGMIIERVSWNKLIRNRVIPKPVNTTTIGEKQ